MYKPTVNAKVINDNETLELATHSLLCMILKELKKINIQLSTMNDEEICDSEI